MNSKLEIGDDIYSFLDNIELNKENVGELIEYVHYKSLLNLFTIIIENEDIKINDILVDYVDVVSRMQNIVERINHKYKDNE